MQQKIGPYEIRELIGRGSVGSVYLATDDRGRDVALKLLEVTPLVSERHLERVVEIAIQTKNIPEHPNIANVWDCGKVDRFYYVAMQLIRGAGTLEQVLNKRRVLNLQEALPLALDIAEGLIHAHKANIVHGDVKPGNILIDEHNRAILNDFVCSARGFYAAGFGQPLVGTPKYMSPQQAKGLYITPQSDIYSFGVVLYEMLTGTLPYDLSTATNLPKMVALISETPPTPPRKLNKTIPWRLHFLLLDILEKNEQFRPQTMSVIRDELNSILAGQSYTPKAFLQRLFRQRETDTEEE